MHLTGSEGSTLNLDELETRLHHQLNHEREQHEATKQLLKNEQDKVRNLLKELDDSNRFADELAAGNRLNANVLQAAMDRIEPNVKEILRTVAAMNAFRSDSHDGASITVNDSQKLPDDTAHQPKSLASCMHEPAFQLSAPLGNDQRPSILYDVLTEGVMDDVDTIPDFHSDVRQNVKHEPFQQVALCQAVKADNKEQTSTRVQVVQAPVQPSEELHRMSNTGKLEPRAPGLGEFHSLDEAFENDFFSKPVGGSDTGRQLSNRKTADDKLIDMGLEGGLPESGAVNSASPGCGRSMPKEPLTSGEDSNKLTVGPVVGRKESTIEHPIIGVEAVSC